MNHLDVNSSNHRKKGQVKIQQMAFVLVAVIFFFAIVLLLWISLQGSSIRSGVEDLREQDTLELVRSISATPEFAWTVTDCAGCIDFDKVLALSNREAYEGFFRGISYLEIRRVHPTYDQATCAPGTYPECDALILIDTGGDVITHSTFVSLCRYDSELNGPRCDLGKIIAGFPPV